MSVARGRASSILLLRGGSRDLKRLIAAARAGSRSALGELLEPCRGYLMLAATRELDADLRRKVGASDLVQETLFEAGRDFDDFHGASEAELLAWLRRALLNNLANQARRYQRTDKRRISREVPLEGQGPIGDLRNALAAPGSSPSSAARHGEEQLALERALASLPDDYQQVVLLRHREALPFSEIAVRMDRSVNAVQKLWTRAIVTLQRELRGTHVEPAT